MSTVSFPLGFVWGAATSAYQIEGATREGGRAESIWDRFSATPGKVLGGENGDVACDHYHRFRDDISLMKQLSLGAYRFSVAWPRILPRGLGAPNEGGLDFYDRLVDALLQAAITPFVTLYHWDLPQFLEDRGGWPHRDTAKAFVDFADIVSRRLGDRVRHWITHNEPWCASVLGYWDGLHAPGRKDPAAALAASHHLLLSHGWAVPIVRANSPGATVGITLNLIPPTPASPSAADQDAARQFDASFNRWFLDPLYGRGYPRDALADHVIAGHLATPELPAVQPGDLAAIATPTDFLGVNYYNRAVVRSDAVSEERNAPRTVFLRDESTDMGWEVYPDGLWEILTRVHREYRPPALYVTENGASYGPSPAPGEHLRDDPRISYLRRHFLAARRALDEGVPLHGYFVWSLLDNFEWDRGYTQRFGITWVDYATQERIPKDSALWYRDVIFANGVSP
jgi:beta-glucosidase